MHIYAATSESLDGMLRDAITHVMANGEVVSSNRGNSTEVRGVVLSLTNPRARLSRSAQRGQFFGALGEFSWYLSGSADLDHVSYYIRGYETFVGDGSGSYGPRLFGPRSRISGIIDLLRERPGTRQAVIQLFDNADLQGNSKDVPCTCTLQFFSRNGNIDLIVHMRSNDVMLGLPFDVFSFTMMQEIVARSLGQEVGTYTHMVGSLHLYVKNEAQAKAYLDEGFLASSPMPAMPVQDPKHDLEAFVEFERAVRQGSTPPKLTDPYWRALGVALDAFGAYRSEDAERMQAARDALVGSAYQIYLTDLHWRMNINERS